MRTNYIFFPAIIFCLLLAYESAYAQKPGTSIVTPYKKPKAKKKKEEGYTNIQIGGGVMGSVLYLSRNINEKNDAFGSTFIFNYGGGNQKLLRYSFQYTKFFPIDIAPTWYNVHAQTFESNVEMMVFFKNKKTVLYPFVGLSYNTFKGFFTGANDYLNLYQKYGFNNIVSNRWIGFNIGTGAEHAFGPVVIFVDYKMRVGKLEERASFTIMDICYTGGIRLKLAVPEAHVALRKLYRGINDKYHWF